MEHAATEALGTGAILGTLIFVLGYIGISIEHTIKVSKSAIALATGGALWVLVGLLGGDHVREEILHSGAEIFEIVVFLLAAMSLVEVLVHYRFFDIVRSWLFRLGLSEKKQFLMVATMAFFLSAVIDNLTATIVSIQIARQFFRGPNLLLGAATIVIAANAGGAWSPIGDVTTIMLWLAEKFDAGQIISQGILPSLAIHITALLLILPRVRNSQYDNKEELVTKLRRSEKIIIGMTFASFTLPLFMNQIGLPPYLGLLLGLGIVWLTIDLVKRIRRHESHLTASIDEFIKKTDIPSLKFFIGILLAVGALNALGILELLSNSIYGADPSVARIVAGNVGLGVLSSILDNVPLTAIAIQILNVTDPALWVLLAITVGTGGSMLVIGSAAGVIAMGMVKELTFGRYLKLAAMPALVSYLVGVGVWLVQYQFIK